MKASETKEKKKPTFRRKHPRVEGAPDDALTLDLNNPAKAQRVDWCQDLISLGFSKATIIGRLMQGRPEDFKGALPPIKSISNVEAYRYFNLTIHLLEEEQAEATSLKRAKYRARLRRLAQAAMLKDQLTIAMQATTLEAAFDGVGPLIGPKAPLLPERDPDDLVAMDEQALDAAILLEEGKTQPVKAAIVKAPKP